MTWLGNRGGRGTSENKKRRFSFRRFLRTVKILFFLFTTLVMFSLVPGVLVAIDTGSDALGTLTFLAYPALLAYWKRKAILSMTSTIASYLATKFADVSSNAGNKW